MGRKREYTWVRYKLVACRIQAISEQASVSTKRFPTNGWHACGMPARALRKLVMQSGEWTRIAPLVTFTTASATFFTACTIVGTRPRAVAWFAFLTAFRSAPSVRHEKPDCGRGKEPSIWLRNSPFFRTP